MNFENKEINIALSNFAQITESEMNKKIDLTNKKSSKNNLDSVEISSILQKMNPNLAKLLIFTRKSF